MSRERDPECRAMLLHETPNAIRVCKLNSPVNGEAWWIPRSEIGYMRKTGVDAPGGTSHTHVTFTLPEWLIEKKQCWELVP